MTEGVASAAAEPGLQASSHCCVLSLSLSGAALLRCGSSVSAGVCPTLPSSRLPSSPVSCVSRVYSASAGAQPLCSQNRPTPQAVQVDETGRRSGGVGGGGKARQTTTYRWLGHFGYCHVHTASAPWLSPNHANAPRLNASVDTR